MFLRPDPSEYRYTVEQKLAMGREAIARGEKTFLVSIVLLVLIVLAVFGTLSGATILGFSASVWWLFVALAAVGTVALNSSMGRCPGCGHFLGGRNHYARVCVWCGIPITRRGLREAARNAKTR